ncbi:MAG: glycosyltransferase [Candidatus Yanofskybacteria bacterium CG10_big_fil_rev_8_21_14_0_10_37_15]|uniref:Glycosyltransferase n=1 Tax=Candidatus Yanofskybacteria bacterium CG10_big_fil_rev_8_21_14_0_10_37_15 TaxID=1975097 RepID=A0A2H0R5L3_9BACT|nr:MAG: glycosyltransferase [Candidatus Yanofskybacteria bacterium CG10_big_fil_rev_8_21_14_0_10_37_15]
MINSKSPYLSVVLPVFNEQETLSKLMEELYLVCDSLNKNYEIIFVDDCSHDRTPKILAEFASKDPRIKTLRFSRNFGHQAALSAGMDIAKGELVVTMDSDLQHPPRIIHEFIKNAEQSYDIVVGERLSNEQNSFFREIAGRTVYKFLSVATGLEFKNAGDFALYKKSVVKVFRNLPEKERFFRGLVQWVGFKKKYVQYIAEARRHGQSKYSFKRLFGFILNGVTSFSAFPLRLAFWLGLIIFLASIIYGGYVVIDRFINPDSLIEGLSALVILVLALGSIQLMVIGIFGEYLYKMFNEIKGRPMYIVAETKNLEEENNA